MRTLRALPLLASLAALGVACSTPKPEPEIASSAGQAQYAETYPADVQAVTRGFGEADAEAKELDATFSGFPEQLKRVDANRALDISIRADNAGRSRSYVDRSREVEGARRFYDAEKEEIGKKIAGTAQSVAKQKGCEADVGTPAAHALDDAMDKQLEKHLREKNDAHLLIDRYRASLGKENAAALEKQADSISRASYLVHIEMVETKVRLDALLAEAEQVKKTLDDHAAAERAFQADGARTDAEKKASAERLEAIEKSRGLWDSSITQAKDASEGIEDRIKAAQDRHAEAIEKLKKAYVERGAKAPESPEAS